MNLQIIKTKSVFDVYMSWTYERQQIRHGQNEN